MLIMCEQGTSVMKKIELMFSIVLNLTYARTGAVTM